MSQLLGIIQRLTQLRDQEPNGNEAPQRNFEVNGEKRCSVTYLAKTDMFILEVYEKGKKPKTYQFDNIDMIAIEIFELLHERSEVR
ncbi:YkuJ family protein [Anoxybacteroides tepidamans]|uniref:YkuJ family protein n=1 Tax=Anoxybacteroides tepidamans TaxID=265948 RepID=UPI0004807950|nr:YkuJ family protein [Anoxybacillus tepidamans]